MTINRLCKPFPVKKCQVGAYLMADIAHISGLVATGEHPSPFPFCDVAWLIMRFLELYYLYNQMWNIKKKVRWCFKLPILASGFWKNIWFRYETSILIVGLWSFILYIQFWICYLHIQDSTSPLVEVVTTTTHKSLRGAWGLKQWVISSVRSVKTLFFYNDTQYLFPSIFLSCAI